MAIDVIMPALGVAQEKGILIKWLKAEGQSVAKGEPLMEIETDKATVEIEASASGVLTNVIASAGDEIPVGHKIAVILVPGEMASAVTPQMSDSPRASEKNPLRAEQQTRTRHSVSVQPAEPGPLSATESRRLLASPAARRIAREKGIPLATIRGTGPKGSVLLADVLRVGADKHSDAEATTLAEVLPLVPMRRIVAERMSLSKQTAPHFYLNMDVDMTAVMNLRHNWKESQNTLIPSFNDFILQACARALKDFSAMNATFTERGIELHNAINLGIAVALEEGLVVPVIRKADVLSLEELAQQSRSLANQAHHRRLLPKDYEGGTFTVSNLGMLGVDSFIAIINPPQAGILAIGKVAPRVVTDGDGVMIRTMMTMSLSADHRVVDGAIAARFLTKIKQLLENPEV